MPLLTPKTQLESDLELLDRLVIDTAEAANHLASTMAASNKRFWDLPPERVVAVLNADLQRANDVLTANTTLGTVVNAHLDMLGIERFYQRVPLRIGNTEISFDGTRFIHTPPPPAVDTDT